jgi:xanthine dehydrogenase/oxidase
LQVVSVSYNYNSQPLNLARNLKFSNILDYYNRKQQIDEFNNQNRWRKRGIAIVPMEYALNYYGTFHATVSVYHADGSISISHGGIEMGQGINTKVAQVAAHILGVPLESIAVKVSNSLTSPNDDASGGSVASESVAFAVKKACEQLLERMKPVRDEMKNTKWADVTQACYIKNIDLCSNYMYKVGDVKTYNIWGTSCVEVELDLLTGNLQVVRADILEDTGESLSPGIDIGQVEGAFVMGLGYWLNESLIYNNQNGELLTNRTWTYKPPGAKDIPIDFRITFLQKSANPFGVLRSKGKDENY